MQEGEHAPWRLVGNVFALGTKFLLTYPEEDHPKFAKNLFYFQIYKWIKATAKGVKLDKSLPTDLGK